jgi:hypothetical protein
LIFVIAGAFDLYSNYTGGYCLPESSISINNEECI